MICISIGASTIKEMIELAKDARLVEFRLDTLNGEELTVPNITSLFSIQQETVATFRPHKNFSDDLRFQILSAAIKGGSSYVDIEIDADEKLQKELINFAKEFETKIILSWHDYQKTPEISHLHEIIKNCIKLGADITKIAAMVNSFNDTKRLLSLLNEYEDLIVVGMGEKGKITRFLAPLFGTPFTFVSAMKGKETAPGQMTEAEWNAGMDILCNLFQIDRLDIREEDH